MREHANKGLLQSLAKAGSPYLRQELGKLADRAGAAHLLARAGYSQWKMEAVGDQEDTTSNLINHIHQSVRNGKERPNHFSPGDRRNLP
ncbi:hypothetical protein EO92_17660 [Methanosarcina sp. 2.H.A.1B.4]|nr:hypothetical protein EO92_17660 [Methanosarcina sp. 2.H.A.1B.4]